MTLYFRLVVQRNRVCMIKYQNKKEQVKDHNGSGNPSLIFKNRAAADH